MNKFPNFWYESNAAWGNVESIEDLREIIMHQTDRSFCGIFGDVNEFLDKSLQNVSRALDFGTRREHRGEKTLRQFLVENGVDPRLI